MFIASTITGGQNTNWLSDTLNCGNCTPIASSARMAKNEIDNGMVTSPNIKIQTVPNPFHDRIDIKFSSLVDDNQVRVVIYDLQGRLVSTVFNGKIVANENYDAIFNSEGLSEGTYIYKIFTSTQVFTGKIIRLQ